MANITHCLTGNSRRSCQIHDHFINRFNREIRCIRRKQSFQFPVDPPVFFRIRREDHQARVDIFAVTDIHACFDTEFFGFPRCCQNTAIPGCIRRNYNRFIAKQRVCLLFNTRKTGIEIYMHNRGRGRIKISCCHRIFPKVSRKDFPYRTADGKTLFRQ